MRLVALAVALGMASGCVQVLDGALSFQDVSLILVMDHVTLNRTSGSDDLELFRGPHCWEYRWDGDEEQLRFRRDDAAEAVPAALVLRRVEALGSGSWYTMGEGWVGHPVDPDGETVTLTAPYADGGAILEVGFDADGEPVANGTRLDADGATWYANTTAVIENGTFDVRERLVVRALGDVDLKVEQAGLCM